MTDKLYKEVVEMTVGGGLGHKCQCGIAIVVVIILLLIALGIVF